MIVIDDASKKIESNSLYRDQGRHRQGRDRCRCAQKIIVDRVDKEYGAVFAKSKVELNGAKAPNGNRDGETNNGDLITDAMLWKVMQNKEGLTVNEDHVVAITNGGGIRAAIKAGRCHQEGHQHRSAVRQHGRGRSMSPALSSCSKRSRRPPSARPTAVGGFPQVSGINLHHLTPAQAYDTNDATYPASTYYGPKTINRVVDQQHQRQGIQGRMRPMRL